MLIMRVLPAKIEKIFKTYKLVTYNFVSYKTVGFIIIYNAIP